MLCGGSVVAEQAISDRSSRSTRPRAPIAHMIASECLQSIVDNGKPTRTNPLGQIVAPGDYLGRMLAADNFEFCVDAQMVESIEKFIALVKQYAEGGQLLVEKRVDFSDAIGVPGSTGTADVIILHPNRVTVIDLKYGMGVRVDAENNPQTRLYAIGAMHDYGFMVDARDVVMVIHQPRLDHVSEECITVDALAEFGEEARLAAIVALEHENPPLVPGEKQCRFCNAKSTCVALKNEVTEYVGHVASANDFADLAKADNGWLSIAMGRVPLIEHWCKAIRAETERRLFAGDTVQDFKLVEGRKGNRGWTDEAEGKRA